MSKYDITDDMNQWEYAIYNMLQRQKEMGIIPTTKPTAATPEEQIEESLKNPYESQAETTPKPRTDNSSKNPYAQRENPYAPVAKSPYKDDYGAKPAPKPAEEVIEEEEEEERKEPWKNFAEKKAELIRRSIEHLQKKDCEGFKAHIYLDTEGKMTTGIGANIDNKATFMSLDWQINGRPATYAEKLKAYNDFLDLKAKNKYGEKYGAKYFKDISTMRLPNETIYRLCREHVEDDIAMLRAGVKGFDDFPIELQEVLVDIRYNTGNLYRHKWPKLRKALDERDLESIYDNVNRY